MEGGGGEGGATPKFHKNKKEKCANALHISN